MAYGLPTVGGDDNVWGPKVNDSITAVKAIADAATTNIAALNQFTGTGSPEGVIAAPVGATYRDTAATTGALVWQKQTGTGNTGWVVTVGDTGRRDISASFTGGWTGYLYIQRKNSVIYITTYNIVAGTGTTLPVPLGFQPNTGADGFAIGGATWAGATGVLKFDASTSAFTASALNDSTAFTIIQPYVTFQAWPSSLPGTAV